MRQRANESGCVLNILFQIVRLCGLDDGQQEFVFVARATSARRDYRDYTESNWCVVREATRCYI